MPTRTEELGVYTAASENWTVRKFGADNCIGMTSSEPGKDIAWYLGRGGITIP
jgi:hypothetical protein